MGRSSSFPARRLDHKKACPHCPKLSEDHLEWGEG